MKNLAIVACMLLLALAPDTGRAHSSHGAVAVFIESVQSDPRTGGEHVLLDLSIENITANAVTLRGLRLESHGPVVIERLRSVLGLKSWQPVRFLRLEPGENMDLKTPDFRIAVPTKVWHNASIKLYADFGPLGEVVVYNPFSEGPQTTL